MQYRRYNIRISLMKETDIEMVRNWRNDPVVVKNYAYKEYITPEMQRKWFESINNIHNLYTIIEYRGEKIGVINMKNIDWERKTFEGGIFIPYEKYHFTMLPAIISFITTEIPFIMLDWNVGYAHVLKENKATQSFIKMLGYQLSPGQEDKPNQEYSITRETFEKKAAKIRKAISVMAESNEPASLFIEKDEWDDPLVMQWENIAKSSRWITSIEEIPEGRRYTFA